MANLKELDGFSNYSASSGQKGTLRPKIEIFHPQIRLFSMFMPWGGGLLLGLPPYHVFNITDFIFRTIVNHPRLSFFERDGSREGGGGGVHRWHHSGSSSFNLSQNGVL